MPSMVRTAPKMVTDRGRALRPPVASPTSTLAVTTPMPLAQPARTTRLASCTLA